MPSLSATVQLTMDLIARPSVTPDDAGCQELLIARLEPLGFEIERMRFGKVDNFWALRRGGPGPIVCFAGHTDVVPPGPLERWSTDPFEPVIRDGIVYGRGAADMKSGVAAMVTAASPSLPPIRAIPEQSPSSSRAMRKDRPSTARAVSSMRSRRVASGSSIASSPSRRASRNSATPYASADAAPCRGP